MNRKDSFINFIWKLFKPYLLPVILSIIFVTVSTISSTLSPLYEGKIITFIFSEISINNAVRINKVYHILIILLLLYSTKAIFDLFSITILTNVMQKFVKDLRDKVYEKLLKLPLTYFNHHSKGEIFSKFSNDIEIISNSFQSTIISIFSNILSFVFIVVVMLKINYLICTIMIIFIPITFLITKLIFKYNIPLFQKQQEQYGAFNGILNDAFSCNYENIIFNQNINNLRLFTDANSKLYNFSFKANLCSGLVTPILNLFACIMIAVELLFGIFLFLNGMIEIGLLQTFYKYSSQIQNPILEISQLSSNLQGAYVSLKQLHNFLNEDEFIENIQVEKLDNLHNYIEFQNVSFKYDEHQVISNFTFAFKKGETIAIVGHTGSGKTTLLNLILKLYLNNDGHLSYDRVNYNSISSKTIRDKISVVLQDPWLFSGTILENIQYGNNYSSEEEIIFVSKKLGLHPIIMNLPQGYDTLIEENDSNLSRGVKQLISIARAAIKNYDIILLDEATSSLDTYLEYKTQNAINIMSKNKTCIIVAHRISTVTNANTIIVMNDGKIDSIGNHKTLLKNSEIYRNLFYSQY